MEKKRVVLVPQYMRKFSCIGSDCEDSCCTGWRVDIDEITYKKYRKVSDLELKPLLEKRITRNRSKGTTAQFAKIRLEANNRCPFLSGENLCNIQLKLGVDYLSNTCTTYPRTTNKVNGMWEKSATMSCPEVARLALLNPDGIAFDEIEEPIDPRNIVSRQINSNSKLAESEAKKYFWELRIFTIQVLQDREYSLSDRLIILGLFYQKAQKYIEDNRVHDIPELIATYTNFIEEGIFKEELQNIPVQNAIQMELLKELTDVRFSQGAGSKRYVECLAEMLHGIEYSKEATVSEIAERYAKAFEEYYYPFMKHHEYVLENYLVNHVYKNLFPFAINESLFDNYVMMVIHYAMIKLHLIGMAGYHKEAFHMDSVVKLIQSFAKTVEHNNQYLARIHNLLKENGFTTMAYMAILIKN